MRVLAIGLAFVLVSCGGETASSEPEATPAEPEPAPPVPAQQPTETIDPEPVRAEDAPERADLALVDRPTGAAFEVPDGFRVQLYAEGLEGPDALTISPEGDVLVTEREAGRIQRLIDADDDGVAELREVFGDETNELDHPHGMAFTPGAVFIANRATLMRHAYPEGRRRLVGSGGRIGHFDDAQESDRHPLVLTPDRRHLYVSIAADPINQLGSPERGTIVEVNFSGVQRRVYASGVRLAFDLALRQGALFAAVMAGPGGEFLTPIEEDHTLRGDFPLRFARGSGVSSMAFYGGSTFPERYRGGLFVCLSDRAPGVVFVPFEGSAPADHYFPFVAGFESDAAAWGRPRGILVTSDGSLLFTDGVSRVFRVSWAG